jgi:hypothetical protein
MAMHNSSKPLTSSSPLSARSKSWHCQNHSVWSCDIWPIGVKHHFIETRHVVRLIDCHNLIHHGIYGAELSLSYHDRSLFHVQDVVHIRKSPYTKPLVIYQTCRLSYFYLLHAQPGYTRLSLSRLRPGLKHSPRQYIERQHTSMRRSFAR